MRYHSLGQVPQKRHVQFRDPEAESTGNGQAPLLVEEVLGFEGFSGNESILYHLWSPCRISDVGEFTRIELEEWVPETHVHRLTNTMPMNPFHLTFDRPFTWAIEHAPTGTQLFVGRVVNPNRRD